MNAAFFYPYVHFKSRHWLKSALLYYDEIVRIVTPGLDPDTPEEYSSLPVDPRIIDDVAQLKAAGFIRHETPTAEQLNSAAEAFVDFSAQSLLTPGDRERILPAFRSANPFVRMNPANVSSELVEILREAKLAHESINDKYSALKVEPLTAVAYATLLANELAGSRDLVTDDAIYHRLLLQTNKAQKPEGEAGSDDKAFRVAAMAFESVGFSQGVSIKTILAFREKYAAERARFSAAITKLSDSMKEPTPDNLQSCAESLTDSLETLKDKLKSQSVTFAGCVFSVSAPAWLTAAWGLAATGTGVIGGAVALALSLGSVKYFYDRRALRRESPYTYLLEISKSLAPQHLASLMVEPLPFDDLEYRADVVPCL